MLSLIDFCNYLIICDTINPVRILYPRKIHQFWSGWVVMNTDYFLCCLMSLHECYLLHNDHSSTVSLIPHIRYTYVLHGHQQLVIVHIHFCTCRQWCYEIYNIFLSSVWVTVIFSCNNSLTVQFHQVFLLFLLESKVKNKGKHKDSLWLW